MFVRFLKQQGFLDIHITIWSQSLDHIISNIEPLSATINAMVHLLLLCFPPRPFFPFSARPFCGVQCKIAQVHPYLQYPQVSNLS